MSLAETYKPVLETGRAIGRFSLRQLTHEKRLMRLMARFHELNIECLDFCFQNRESLAEAGLLEPIAEMMNRQATLNIELSDFGIAMTEHEESISEDFADIIEMVMEEIEQNE